MSPRQQQSSDAMPAPAVSAASAITVQHPGGSIRVSAPTDVPLSELTPEGERKIKDIELEDNRFRLKMEPHRPYVLRKTPKRVVDNSKNTVSP